MSRIILDVDGVHQHYGSPLAPVKILHDVNLQVVQGQFVAVVGPSGCGKTTLFRAILGTDPPKQGIVETDGYVVRGPNRHVGVVYQRYTLYPFLTAEENVAFGLMLDETGLFSRTFMPWRWWPLRKKHLQIARDMLEKVRLGHACKRYPKELSGGMQQRVAIAQALVMKPKILLLDEPFGALDEATREELQVMLLELYAENLLAKSEGKEAPWTLLFVTHELNEAFYVSDRLVALSKNWKETVDGEERRGTEWGASKVWDKPTPVFHPDAPKDFARFEAAKKELRRCVLDADGTFIDRSEHVCTWSELSSDVGTGVAFAT